jgi:hypothetical protein
MLSRLVPQQSESRKILFALLVGEFEGETIDRHNTLALIVVGAIAI